jgi:hypothetical protein
MSETPDFIRRPDNAPDGVFARFYVRPVQNELRTASEGRPIFEDVEYVEINLPGDRTSVVDRRVKADDRQRWPQQYAAFKDGQEQVGDGTPLTQWTGVTRSQVEELAFFKIRTVEQLAGLNDGALANLPLGLRAMKEHAERWLASAAGGKPAEALAAEVAKRDATITTMQGQMADMRVEIDRLKLNQKEQIDGS